MTAFRCPTGTAAGDPVLALCRILTRLAPCWRLCGAALAGENAQFARLVYVKENAGACHQDSAERSCSLHSEHYQVMRAVYCNTRAPCAEVLRLMIPSVLGVPIPG